MMVTPQMLLLDIYKIPVVWSLAATVTVLAVTMILSLLIPPKGAAPRGAYPFKAKETPGTDDPK